MTPFKGRYPYNWPSDISNFPTNDRLERWILCIVVISLPMAV